MLSKARLFFLPILLLASGLHAQTAGTGIYSFGSFDSKGFDTINLGNLNVHYEIPIVNKPGRGLPFVYTLVYDSLIWSSANVNGVTQWQPNSNWGFQGELYGAVVGYITYDSGGSLCGNYNVDVYMNNIVYHDSFGRSHLFNYSWNVNCSGTYTSSGDGSTSDGSGFRYDGEYVYSAAGNKILPNYQQANSTGQITDSNGNTITNNQDGSYTDTLGVKELTIAGQGSASSPLQLQYPVTEQAGGATAATATVYYSTYNIQTNFGCSGISEYATTVDLVDHVTLADGVTTYRFGYEPTPGVSGAYTGRLHSITLPTGGQITYTYSAGCSGGINGNGSPATMVRTTSNGASKTYASILNGTQPTSTTYVSDEVGNETDFVFAQSDISNWYETSRLVWQGSSSNNQQLESRTTAYNNLASNAQITGSITATDVVDSFNGMKPSEVTSSFDGAGGQTSSSVKDQSTNTVLLGTSTSFNAYEEPTDVETTDGSGQNLISHTSYGYDETTPTPTSSIPQHTSGQSGGNLTSVHSYYNVGLTLDTINTYYDTGALQTSKTNGFTTTFTPDSTQTFITGTSLPTPSSGASLSTSAQYDNTSGVQLSVTGMNSGQTISYTQYDPLLRLTQVTSPSPNTAQTPNGQTTYVYTPSKSTATTTMNASQSAVQETFLDPFGRVVRSAIRADLPGQGSPTWYLTDACYDSAGRLQYQSTPYVSSTDNPSSYVCSTSTGSTYTYDALGRVTSIGQADGSSVQKTWVGRSLKMATSGGVSRIFQYDVLGRTIAVCELSSNQTMPNSGAPGPCSTSPASTGFDQSGTGFVTNYGYAYNGVLLTTTVTQGMQTRTFVTDMLGRTVSMTEPEAGTTTYSYSYNGTGLQTVRTRPRANVAAYQAPSPIPTTTTTTQYDALGRMLTVSYSDGTPTKNFGYDVFPGQGTLGDSLGQLTYANNSNGQKTFTYDIMGRVSVAIECLPSWCAGGMNVARWYGYDSASNLATEQYATQLNYGSPATLTYQYSLAGQLASITGTQNNTGSPQAIYTASSLAPSGPTAALLGNGKNAAYLYDAAGQISGGWMCTGSTQPDCSGGALLYGYRDTISGHRVTHSGDTVLQQQRDYGYDEFGRLQTVSTTPNSGPVISIAFQYDRYGNRTEQNVSGSSPQQLSFNPTTNQISTDSYDVAGNVISDGVNSYTYDAENNLLSVSGGTTASYLYNVFNQRTRVMSNGDFDQYNYDLAGRRATAWKSNGSLDSAQVYAGGSKITYWSSTDSSLHYEFQDWLGTERIRTDSSGNIEGAYSSLPFGDGLTVSGSDTNPAHFAMLDHDGPTGSGLEHAVAREYQSTAGRWLSPDSYTGSYSGNPQSLNRYVYARNNPLIAADPSGLEPCAYSQARIAKGHASLDYSGENGVDNDPCGDKAGEEGGDPETVDVDDDASADSLPVATFYLTVNVIDGTVSTIPTTSETVNVTADPINAPDSIYDGPGPTYYIASSDPGGDTGSAPNNGNKYPPTIQSRMQQAAHAVCGASPATRVAKSVIGGFAIGFGVGAFKGFVAGELFGGEVSLGATGVVGAVAGGFIQGAVGAVNGLGTGTALAAECKAGFVYDHN